MFSVTAEAAAPGAHSFSHLLHAQQQRPGLHWVLVRCHMTVPSGRKGAARGLRRGRGLRTGLVSGGRCSAQGLKVVCPPYLHGQGLTS